MSNKRRNTFLSIIVALVVLGGIWGTISSFPFSILYTSIKQGEITVPNIVSITQIQPNTPAEEVKLQPGDTIISVNEQLISSSEEFINFSSKNHGEPLNITIEREGQKKTVQLTPDKNPEPAIIYV